MNTLQDKFAEHMNKYGKAIEINGLDTIGFFMEIDNKQSTDEKYLFTEINQVSQGNVIQYNSTKWLCTGNPVNINGVYDKSVIKQVKYSIKFAMPSGSLSIFPSLIDTKVFDTSTGQYITIPEGKILVTMPENEDSNKITADLRFIIMGSAWKVTGIDKSKIGLITLYCDKSQFDTVNDDIENEIADAHKYIHTYTINITNGDSADLDYREATLQLTVSCTDNGEVVSSPVVTYSSDNIAVATVDTNGLITCHAIGQAVITTTYNDVSDTFIINGIEVVTDNYSIEYQNPITSIYQGQTKTLTIKVLNNGVEVFDKSVTWSISNTSLATITGSTNTTCTIKASNSNLGNVTLSSRLSDDANVFKDAVIQVKSIV